MKRSRSAIYRYGFVLTLGVLLFGLIATSIVAAFAEFTFEGGDGNLVAGDSGGALDWGSFNDPVALDQDLLRIIGVDQPSGQIGLDIHPSLPDDSFKSAKEDEQDPQLASGSIPKNKSDLKRFYVAHERVIRVIDDVEVENDFLYLAWERANTLGSANIDFEFNQSKEISANGVTPVRSAGDMLITYAFGGNNEEVDIGLSRWVTDSNGSCEAASSPPCWGPVAQLAAGEAEAAINSVPVFEPFLGEYIPERTFGEVALNLTEIGVFDSSACVNFGSAYVKSRSSGSFNSAMKDFIAPIKVDVTNCGSLMVNIQTDPAISGATYTFSATGSEPPVDTEITADSAYYSLRPGTYTITVEAPETKRVSNEEGELVLVEHGYDLTGISCLVSGDGTIATPDPASGTVMVTVGEGGTVDCTYSFVQRGSIVLTKTTEPPLNSQMFSFTGDLSGSIAHGGTITLDDITPGPYSATEARLAGWDLTAISCDDQDSVKPSGEGPVAGTATFNLDPGETVTCTFTNTQRGEIIIEKQTLPSGDPQSFSFTGDVGGDLTEGNPASLEVIPGTYSSTEAALAGWDLTSIVCDDLNSSGNFRTATATFQVEPGESVKCTFTNTKRGQITVEKKTLPSGDPQSFSFTGDVGGDLTEGNPASLEVIPGTYTATELPLDGWDLTGITCSDGSDPGSINLAAGEVVTCTFGYTQRGQIIVEKQTLPDGDLDPFTFSGDVAGILFDDGTSSAEVVPGIYRSTETVPFGWDLTSIVCDDLASSGDPGTKTATFDIKPGQVVKCTFTNVKRGTIIIEKAISGPSPIHYVQLFNISLNGPSGFNENIRLAQIGTTSATFANIPAGSYSISESRQDGWAMVDLSCADGRAQIAPVELAPGATVTCVVTNKMQLYFGSIGYWSNWNNHHTADELQVLIDWVKFNNPKVYDPDLDITTLDAIFISGGVPEDQRLLAKLTAVKLDLAASDPNHPQLQLHAYLYRNCLLDLSSMPGAQAYFGAEVTVGDVVDYVELHWSGNLGGYTWGFAGPTDVSMFTGIFNGIYLGNLVVVDPTTYPDNPGCLQKLAISPVGSAGAGEFGTESASSLPVGAAGVPYSLTLVATGGEPPYIWSISGAPPAWLSLDSASGVISGTPDVNGSWTFTIHVMDSAGSTDAAQLSMTSVVDTTPPTILDLPPSVELEATSPDGAPHTYGLPAVTDAVDSAPSVAAHLRGAPSRWGPLQ